MVNPTYVGSIGVFRRDGLSSKVQIAVSEGFSSVSVSTKADMVNPVSIMSSMMSRFWFSIDTFGMFDCIVGGWALFVHVP